MAQWGLRDSSPTIRCIEIKASLMDDPNVNRKAKHRIQIAAQPGSGTASIATPIMDSLIMSDTEATQAVCCRLGLTARLTLPGLNEQAALATNCSSHGRLPVHKPEGFGIEPCLVQHDRNS